MNKQKQSRRRSALQRLKDQLAKGNKNAKVDGKQAIIPLSDHDIKRIEKEVAKLEQFV